MIPGVMMAHTLDNLCFTQTDMHAGYNGVTVAAAMGPVCAGDAGLWVHHSSISAHPH